MVNLLKRVPKTVPTVFGESDWSVADEESGGTLTVTIAALPSYMGPAISDIEYRVDAGAWVSSETSGVGSFDIAELTDDVEVDVELQGVNVDGVSGASDTKAETPTTA